MSLTSWAIVLARHRDPANSRAAFVYLVMASFGTLCLLLGFGLLAGPAGGYAFETIRLTSHTPFAATLAVVLALLGAGSKAAWCRFMSGCRSPIRLRPATFRRCSAA